MNRGNRFEADQSSSAQRRISVNKEKEIFIQNISTNETKPLKIAMNKTVKQLKKEIQKLFNLDYSLDEYSLRVKTSYMNAGKLIQEQFENKTLYENNFKSECTVIFGKEKNRGG